MAQQETRYQNTKMSHNIKNKIRKQEYKNLTLNVQVRSSFMKMIS